MKKIITTIKKAFTERKKEERDPIYDFFVHDRSSNKKKIYTRALEGADVDQKKIIEKYNNNLKLQS